MRHDVKESHRYLTTASVPGSGHVNTEGRVHRSLVCFIIQGLLNLSSVCSLPLEPIYYARPFQGQTALDIAAFTMIKGLFK